MGPATLSYRPAVGAAMARPTVTAISPPRLASLAAQRAQLDHSSRALAFARDGDRLLRAWGSPERPWAIAVSPDADRWRVEAWGVGPVEARRAAWEMFSLDHPLEEFYRQVRREPVLQGTERRFRGLRIPRDASVYESLLYAIIGQQLSVRSASAIVRRLFDRAGRPLDVGGIEVPAVPAPSRVGALPIEQLRSLGLSGAKSRSVREIARWSGSDPPTPAALRALPRDEAVARLDALPGVGRWTAENALLRSVGRTDLFIAGDLGLRVALARYADIARDRPESEARAWADAHYPGWGSYATLYLWRKMVADRAVAESG